MNPFRYGQVVGGEYFCPRPELLQSLTDFIDAGQNVCLQGERRTGKTSLIHEAAVRLSGVRLLYIDLMETKTPADVCRRMLTAMVRAERSAGFHQRILRVLSHLRPSLSLDPVTGLPSISLAEARAMGPDSLEGILDMLADLGGRRLMVAMDEFQDILDIRSSRETIALLRSRIQFQSDICYIFAGSVRSRMEAVFTDPESPFFKSAALLEVGPIRPDEFVPFLRRRFLAGDRQVSDGVMRQVMKEAGPKAHGCEGHRPDRPRIRRLRPGGAGPASGACRLRRRGRRPGVAHDDSAEVVNRSGGLGGVAALPLVVLPYEPGPQEGIRESVDLAPSVDDL